MSDTISAISPAEPSSEKSQDKPKDSRLRDRPFDERPYVWFSRKASEMIQRAAGIGPDLSYLIATYSALCRLSSERENTAEVRVKIKIIAGMIGLRFRKTQMLLAMLEDEAKVIKTLPLDGHPDGQVYLLLRLSTRAPSCRGNTPTPVHTDAGDPCTKPKQKNADRLKQKRNRITNPRRAGARVGDSVSPVTKKRRDSKPANRLNASAVLNQSLQNKKAASPAGEPHANTPVLEFKCVVPNCKNLVSRKDAWCPKCSAQARTSGPIS